MSDQQLLELAAKAVGMPSLHDANGIYGAWVGDSENGHWWNPLEDDGDALRLAVNLRLQVVMYSDWVEVLRDGIRMTNATSEYFAGCMFATARSAIVRAAAETHRREVEEQH
ncbi:hypothetical protein [Pseudomonas fulva]|uniref:hypothetical protein n=1 Tax=Pseudomonas fulva TaxID=47880 RepID=UPI002B1DD8FB|nr:hypothetical protein [Pseudomonas fulva]